MKRKEYLLLLCLTLLTGACAGRRNSTDATSDAAITDSIQQTSVDSTEECSVDQSAGWQVIEALSKAYSDEPNVINRFIGSSRCPSFLEGMYFDGATLVFQVRGDTVQARRTLEQAAGNGAFRLEQVTEETFSEMQLHKILVEINQRYKTLPQNSLLRRNMTMWGATAHHVYVQFIQNTPEARREFREKLSDSPAVRFDGPEEPEINGMVGITETQGISLHPEYSVYADTATTASFLLINRSSQELMCGEHYSITYEDEQGTWRTLPINTFANDIGYLVPPGDYHRFVARLYPDIHRNKPGRYRFFYDVTLNKEGRKLNMMTEFRLTDNGQEVRQAVKIQLPSSDKSQGDTIEIRYISPVSDRNASATENVYNNFLTSLEKESTHNTNVNKYPDYYGGCFTDDEGICVFQIISRSNAEEVIKDLRRRTKSKCFSIQECEYSYPDLEEVLSDIKSKLFDSNFNDIRERLKWHGCYLDSKKNRVIVRLEKCTDESIKRFKAAVSNSPMIEFIEGGKDVVTVN